MQEPAALAAPNGAPTPVEKDQAIALFKAGRHGELESRARLLVQRYPDSGFAWKVLAVSLQAQGKDALTALQKTARFLPDDAGAHCNLGAALIDLGQFDAAVASCRRALAIDSEYAEAHCNLGIALQGLHQLDAAAASCRRALAINPEFAEAHAALGNALKALRLFNDAATSYRQAVEIKPDFAAAHCNLGATLIDLGQFEGAAASCRLALAIDPEYAEAHCNLGVALQGLRQLEAAAASCRRAITIKPDFAEAHNSLGNALQALGKREDALASYRRALAINRDYAEAHSNSGNVLRDLGNLDEAVASYRRALVIKSDFAEAHNNLGASLQALGKLVEAAASCRQALVFKPDFAEAHNNLGNVLRDLGQLDEAAASCRRALAIRADFAEAHSNLGSVYRSMGNWRDARACYRHAQELGFDGAWVLDALMLPAIMGTRQEVLESRAEFERNLDRLTARAVPQIDPLRNIGEANFYLAYHGLNDRDLQIKVAKYYEQACPTLLFSAPHCAHPKSDLPEKIRVGFLSKYLYDHSVSLCFSKIIESLSLRGQFDVTLISEQPIDEKIYSGYAGRRVHLPHNLVRARETLANLALDVLVYLDIGMEPLSYFLAFSRLAHVQCVLGGHPVTTGIGNVDYFLSNSLMEPPGADDHYSEKLAILPRPLFYFARPVVPNRLKARTELGLPAARHIYMCPMRLQKMHPDFDAAIARILQIDDNGVIVLFEDIELSLGRKLLEARFEQTIPPDVRARIIFLPWLKDPTDFVSAVAAADVILDPFHFGIGSTAMTTFAAGIPLVTKAGEFMRGRVGMCLCNMLDLPECIAEDTETYAQRAVQIASNQVLRDTITAKIRNNRHVLYENLQPADDLANFLCSVTARPAKQP